VKRRCPGSRGLALLSLSLLLGACRTATAPAAPGAGASPTAPPIAVERAARSGGGAEDIVYDAGQMAELPCHSMAFTIMGRCTEDEVQLLAAEIQRRAAAGTPIGIIEARKLEGAGAAVDDRRPTAEDGATPSAEGDAGAAAKLADKVKKGGQGVWGPVPMPPNAAVKDEDIKTMVAYVLALKK
jgi:cytochrome c